MKDYRPGGYFAWAIWIVSVLTMNAPSQLTIFEAGFLLVIDESGFGRCVTTFGFLEFILSKNSTMSERAITAQPIHQSNSKKLVSHPQKQKSTFPHSSDLLTDHLV